MVNRKKFLHLTSLGLGSLMVPGILSGSNIPAAQHVQPGNNSAENDLATMALNAARSKGAAYADVRIGQLKQPVAYGMGIRVLVAGKWGFAATTDLSTASIMRCAETAVANATENQSAAPVQKRYQYDLKAVHEVWRCALLR